MSSIKCSQSESCRIVRYSVSNSEQRTANSAQRTAKMMKVAVFFAILLGVISASEIGKEQIEKYVEKWTSIFC